MRRSRTFVMTVLLAVLLATGASAQNGFLVRFWYGTNFDKEEPAAEMVVPAITTQYRPHGNPPTVPPGLELQGVTEHGEAVCAEYTATLKVPQTAKYALAVYAPQPPGAGGMPGPTSHWRAGVRMWLDGKLVIDEWAPTTQGTEAKVAHEARILAGDHDLKLQGLFTPSLGFRSLYLAWKPEGEGFQFIPEDLLTPVRPEGPMIVRQLRDILNKGTESKNVEDLLKDLEAFLSVLERYAIAH